MENTQRTAAQIDGEITQRKTRVAELTARQSTATDELATARRDYNQAMAYEPAKAAAIHKKITALDVEITGISGALQALESDIETLRGELWQVHAIEAHTALKEKTQKYFDTLENAEKSLPPLREIVSPVVDELDKALSDYRKAYEIWMEADKATGGDGEHGVWRDAPQGSQQPEAVGALYSIARAIGLRPPQRPQNATVQTNGLGV